MKLHIVTIGVPKLAYAKTGFAEYTKRLRRYHDIRVSHLADKFANDSDKLLQTAGTAYKVALIIDGGTSFSSERLSHFLDTQALAGRELCFLIGGPEGLPADVINACDYRWSLSQLTFPHDLAMLIIAEALYRASTIIAGHPYHRG